MTIHIPKGVLWALGVLVVAGAVVAAYLMGQSSGDEGGPDEAAVAKDQSQADASAAGDEAADEPPAQPAPCTEQAAKRATVASGFADRIVATGEISAELAGVDYSETPEPARRFWGGPAGYHLAILKCRDLTGDGVEEMIVAPSAGAAGNIFNWAIFTPTDAGEWELAFSREAHQISSLKVKDGLVVESAPIYRKRDPLCCPSGNKTTEIGYEDGEFVVVFPENPPGERKIAIDEQGVPLKLGRLDLQEGSGPEAIAKIGTPTAEADPNGDEVCRMEWSDLGLVIHFVNLGGANSCGPKGRVGSVELLGTPAEQARWKTNEGVRVGMSLEELRELYPQAKRQGNRMVLIEREDPYGLSDRLPTLTAHVGDGEVLALSLGVGAGGE